MGLSLKPEHLKRYRDVALLLLKHGRRDIAQQSGLLAALPGEDEADPAKESGKPDQLADDLERLGPLYVKFGQLLSTRGDILPPAYMASLERLQDNVAPFGFGDVQRIVEEELGVRISKAFSRFDEVPLASASLGQVHRAALRDGREVVVKVQRPNIRSEAARDIEALMEVAEFLDRYTDTGRRYHTQHMLEEFGRTLARELDYRQEAKNLRRVRENLAGFDRIVIPEAVDDFTTTRVLTMEFIHGRKVTTIGGITRLEMDGTGLAEELFRAYLHMIIVDGFFHADPHPGNVFLTDDYRIALLDLGMVGHIPPRLQTQLLQLLIAISEARSDEAADLVIRLGEKREDFDESEFRREAAALVVDQQNASISEMQIGRVILNVARTSAEHGVNLPNEFTLLGKTLMNLDKVAGVLDPDFNPNGSIRRNVMEIMQKRALKDALSSNIFATVLETKDFVEHLPERLNRLIDLVADNGVKLQVEAIDEKTLIEGFQKIANRITVGLVIAALVVGAALLMQVSTPFTILGYPGLAMLCFLFAAGCGFWLIFSVLLGDRQRGLKRAKS